jgi:hypothetical protein
MYAVGALGVAAVVGIVAVVAGGGKKDAPAPAPTATLPAPAPAPVAVVPAPPAKGRAHVVIEGGGPEGARVLLDGKLLAEGVREARLPDVAPGTPHVLRVEAAGRPSVDRTFDVAAGADVELAVKLVTPGAPHPGGRRREHDATTATTPAPAGGDKRHRDGLVGDDIFDSPKK